MKATNVVIAALVAFCVALSGANVYYVKTIKAQKSKIQNLEKAATVVAPVAEKTKPNKAKAEPKAKAVAKPKAVTKPKSEPKKSAKPVIIKAAPKATPDSFNENVKKIIAEITKSTKETLNPQPVAKPAPAPVATKKFIPRKDRA